MNVVCTIRTVNCKPRALMSNLNPEPHWDRMTRIIHKIRNKKHLGRRNACRKTMAKRKAKEQQKKKREEGEGEDRGWAKTSQENE